MIPLYKYFVQYAHKEALVECLYRNVLDDCIFMSKHTLEEAHDICEKSFDEIFKFCQDFKATGKTSEGYLSILTNGTLDEVCLYKNNEHYDMMFEDWNTWMEYLVDETIPPEKFCESLILTMTFIGFSYESHKKRAKEITDMLSETMENDRNNLQNYYSIEQFDEYFKKLIGKQNEDDG